MVNASATDANDERRRRPRASAAHAFASGGGSLNPFGDLHTLQHLSARLARSTRGVFEPLLRRELRTWAEPLSVQRFADYRAERGEALTAWQPLAITPGDINALVVLDGRFVLELLDLFFGGTGAAPEPLPTEFSPAADALVARVGALLAPVLKTAWEPVARLSFAPGKPEPNPALVAAPDGDDPVVVTRFGLAAGAAQPAFFDILYPVAALKPHGQALTGKVVARAAQADAGWRNGLTRAVMGVRFPVRSVLAEPSIPLAKLMELKPGDVIPISFGTDVPVMVGRDRLGAGTVGTSNGRAAIRLTQLTRSNEDQQ